MKVKNLVVASAALMIIGCSSNGESENLVPQEVTVGIDYSLWESGSMTKSGESLYTDFYNKYIKTKQLTPTSYSLSFNNKDMVKISTVNGYWKEKAGIRLVEGTYEVIGTSTPSTKEPIDSIALSFNEKVAISSETTSITLTAKYSSYMLMFDAASIKSIDYSEYTDGVYRTYTLKKLDNIFYVFIHHEPKDSDKVVITRNNSIKVEINLYGLNLEKGKYYYFNDVTNSFDIPPMQGGN